MDPSTDHLLLLGVRKPGLTGAKPHLVNLVHHALLLLGAENLSTGTSKHSAMQKLYQRLAEKFNLVNFAAMTHYSCPQGKMRPQTERRLRCLAPALAQQAGKKSMGLTNDVFTRCILGVTTTSPTALEVVVGARMKEVEFDKLLQTQTLPGMARLVCELLTKRGARLGHEHLAPICTQGLDQVTLPVSSQRSKAGSHGDGTSSASTSSDGKAKPHPRRPSATVVFTCLSL